MAVIELKVSRARVDPLQECTFGADPLPSPGPSKPEVLLESADQMYRSLSEEHAGNAMQEHFSSAFDR